MKLEWIRISENTYAANMPGDGVVLRKGAAMCYVPDICVVLVPEKGAPEHVADLYRMQKSEIGEPCLIGELRQ